VLKLAEAGLAEMRAILFELRPESLEQEGLVVALEKQAASLRVRRQIKVVCKLGSEPDAPLAVKEALYRVAQDGLQNVVEHARAGCVTIRLSADPDALVLDLHDDGVGFNPDTPTTTGGLRQIRERVARLGGRSEIASVPGIGTRILARIPLTTPADPVLSTTDTSVRAPD
jgi:signal transduction histidine kinase